MLGWLALAAGVAYVIATQETGRVQTASLRARKPIKLAKVVAVPFHLPARLVAKVVGVEPVIEPLDATAAMVPLRIAAVAVPSLWSESQTAEVPIYSEMPPIPPGWRAVNVWGPKFGEKTGRVQPRPDRFRQWAPLHSGKSWADYSREWQNRYWFGVVSGDVLTFYVLGKPSTGLCCETAERRLYMLNGEGVERRGAAGDVRSPWQCKALAPECFDAMTRRAWATVPRIGKDWKP